MVSHTDKDLAIANVHLGDVTSPIHLGERTIMHGCGRPNVNNISNKAIKD